MSSKNFEDQLTNENFTTKNISWRKIAKKGSHYFLWNLQNILKSVYKNI